MKPYLFGLQSYYLMWLVAAVVGIAAGMRLTHREGFPRWRAFAALCAFAFTIFLGSKLLFVVEHLLYPLDDPLPAAQDSLGMLAWHGFRIPGGILLLAPAFPLICRVCKLPTLRFADAVIPAAGLALLFIRTGCFLNGCCFGGITSSPLSIVFPSGARVWQWQLSQGLIPSTAPYTLPVHPLQLYFAGVGLALYGLGRHWQETKRFDGEVWAKFYIVFFAATFVLEFLRATPLHLNLVLTALVVLLTTLLARRAQRALPAALGVSS